MQGVKGESPLARAVVAENFADGNGFCKHGCRALYRLQCFRSHYFQRLITVAYGCLRIVLACYLLYHTSIDNS